MTNPNIPKTLVELTIDKLIVGYECSKASLDEVRALSKDELKSLIGRRLDIVYPGIHYWAAPPDEELHRVLEKLK